MRVNARRSSEFGAFASVPRRRRSAGAGNRDDGALALIIVLRLPAAPRSATV